MYSSLSFKKCIHLSQYHQNQDMEEFCHPKRFLCVLPSQFLPLLAPGNHGSVLCNWRLDLSFLESPINGILQYVLFCASFVQHVFLGLFHVVAELFHRVNASLLIYPFTYWWTQVIDFLLIINKGVKKIIYKAFCKHMSFLLDKFLGRKLLDHIINVW